MVAGFGPRWLDHALLLVFDAIRSFPVIILGLALMALLGPSLTVILVVAITSVPIYARIVRTQTQSLRSAEFILAERAMGAGAFRIMAVHVLPNVVGPLPILVSMDVPMVIAVEAGMSSSAWGSGRHPFVGNDPQRRVQLHPQLALAHGRGQHPDHSGDAWLHIPRRGVARHL